MYWTWWKNFFSVLFGKYFSPQSCIQTGRVLQKTNKGLFIWLFILFGLSNAEDTFIILINQVLESFLKLFVVLHFDHIRKLKAHKVYVNLIKYIFKVSELFLGFIVNGKDIYVNPYRCSGYQILANVETSKGTKFLWSSHI